MKEKKKRINERNFHEGGSLMGEMVDLKILNCFREIMFPTAITFRINCRN